MMYDAISILVTALVFLALSTGIFTLFKATFRQASRTAARFGVVQVRPGRIYFVVGVICEVCELPQEHSHEASVWS